MFITRGESVIAIKLHDAITTKKPFTRNWGVMLITRGESVIVISLHDAMAMKKPYKTVDVMRIWQMTAKDTILMKVALTNTAVWIQGCLFMARTIVTWSQFPKTS